jgi:hypothetical protein
MVPPFGSILRTIRAGMLAVPSRVSQRLPHLTAHGCCGDRRRDITLTGTGNGSMFGNNAG